MERLSKQTQNENKLIEKYSLSTLSFLFSTYAFFRSIVSKLILSYIDSSANKKDVLHLLSGMLDFSEEERKRVGLVSTGWFNFWRKPKSGDSEESRNEEGQSKSIGDMWVEFLLKEVEENVGSQKGKERNNISKEQNNISQEDRKEQASNTKELSGNSKEQASNSVDNRNDFQKVDSISTGGNGHSSEKNNNSEFNREGKETLKDLENKITHI